jgi:hypothetical protein
MILHFLNDDKFTDYAIDQFSDLEAESIFVVVSYTNDFPKNIRQSGKVTVIQWKSQAYSALLNQLHKYKAIILHGLFDPWIEEIIEHTPEKVKIAWVFWGGEIYGRPDLRNRYLTIEGKFLFFFRKIWIFLKGKKEKSPFTISKKALKRIDYCLTDVSEDFQFVKKYLKDSRMKELWYTYFSIEETVSHLMNSSVNGNNILVGNSSTLENNHLSAFRKLSRFKIADKKIIAPLSYGSPWLKRFLLKKGKRVLGKLFYPITDFLGRDTYNSLILSCSVVIMNHYRHQAMGNTISALWFGSKVFLSKKSTTYSCLKRLGIKLYSVEDDLYPSCEGALFPLTSEEREQNRRILLQEYGKENMKHRIARVVEVLTS